MTTDTLSKMVSYGHEQVVFCNDKESGLRAIIAIHSTLLGPALGGLRMWPYPSEEAALYDVLRLSRGMTYKAAISDLALGGGKAVIIGDPKKDKNKKLFEAFGRYVDSLGGRYITAEDVNIDVHDVDIIRTKSKHVVGTDRNLGGSGDPSPFTALGVFMGIKATAKNVYGSDSLKGRRVLIQGVGSVGAKLAHSLISDGAEVLVSDIDLDRIERLKKELPVEVVSHDKYASTPCDIFSPCALGAILNDQTIPELKCRVVAGGANNQLERPEHAKLLKQRDILYAPDYVINAGGLISVFREISGYSQIECEQKVRGIYNT
ncbi:MAG: Glu/Leu/Phe/Val dehydrogenase, partial [Deltaproteobacteria bacterium]|nr:Glu/Leu/Phe/Val dehydrogenase [Deltaproteobacteria bacterium]